MNFPAVTELVSLLLHTAGSPHPARPDPRFPVLLHCAGMTVHVTEVFQKINPAKISSRCFTGLFFGLSCLL